MKEIKVLFIDPPYSIYSGISGSRGKSIPLNILYLASYLRMYTGINIKIIDAEVLNLSFKDIAKQIKKYLPDIVCITSPTPVFNQAIKVADIIKKIGQSIGKKIIIVMGGIHPTTFPKETLKSGCVDFVVKGEGEITLSELVKSISENKSKNYFKKIEGIVFKDKNKIIETKDRALISNLDNLPFPARDLVNLKLYEPPPTKRVSSKRYSSMLSSRGCNYKCTFCAPQIIWKNKCRVRSAKNVVDELEACYYKHNIGEFNFHDDDFAISEKRVIEICQEILKRKLDIAWVCMVRADTITNKMAYWMEKAGCKKISFGFESGSQDILNRMKKGITIKQIIDATKIAKKYKIQVSSTFIIGYPGETEQSFKETVDLAIKLDLDSAAFFIAAPYPGTELYNLITKNNLFSHHIPWEKFNSIPGGHPVFKLPNFSSEELKKMQKVAYRHFYLRPRYILKKLKELKSLTLIKNNILGLKLLLNIQGDKGISG